MLVVFVGVRAEHIAVDRQIEVLERSELPGYYMVTRGTYQDKPVLVCRTGLGEERVRGIADEILRERHVTAIVSARVASGVPRDLVVGDLALCPRTLLHQAGLGVFPANGESDYRLLQLAGHAATAAGVRHMVGDCLTMSPLRPLPVDREALGEHANLAAVDTEGYWLAEAAFERGIPFLSVRASLGDLYDRLPRCITMLGKRNYVTSWAMLRQNVAHPGDLPNFLRLVEAVRTCSRSLGRFFRAFLPGWAQNPALYRPNDAP